MSWLYPFAGSSRRHHSSSSHSKDRHRSHSSSGHGHSHSHSRHSSHSSSRAPSIFSLGASANRSSASSIFSGMSGFYSSSSSRNRAKPRFGFISRIIRKIRRLFRRIIHYAKRHPVKVFFLVILPLITGGVLQKLLGAVGVRVPQSLQAVGGASREFGGGGSGFGAGGAEGLASSVNGLVSLAKMFV